MEVNRKLKAVRTLRGMKQKDLTRKLARSQSWLCQIERGYAEPGYIEIALICRALHARPEEVFPRKPLPPTGSPAGMEEYS